MTIIKNRLFISQTNYLLLFSNVNSAIRAVDDLRKYGGVSIDQNVYNGISQAYVRFASFDVGKTHIIEPAEPIFLIEKLQDKKYWNAEFWNVIIGERIGWIVICEGPNGTKIQSLERI